MSKERKKEKRMEKDERRRRDSIARGVGTMIVSFIGYIVIPYIIQWYVYPLLPEGIELEGISELLDRWVLGGVPIMIVSLFVGYFGIGSRGWLASSIIHSLLRIGWVLYVLNFGDLTGIFAMEDDGGWQRVDVVIYGFMYLMVALRLLKLLVVYGDYRDNRSAYLNGGEEPADRGRKKKGKKKDDNPSSDGIRVKGRFN